MLPGKLDRDSTVVIALAGKASRDTRPLETLAESLIATVVGVAIPFPRPPEAA